MRGNCLNWPNGSVAMTAAAEDRGGRCLKENTQRLKKKKKRKKKRCPVQMQWFCLLDSQGCLLPPLGLLETLPLCISPPLPSPLFLILAKEYQAAFNCGAQCFSWANELSRRDGTLVHTLMHSKSYSVLQRRSRTGWFGFRCREEKEFFIQIYSRLCERIYHRQERD